ncbi:hypothetical protein JCM19379_15530 [Methyloparacoccus murrellii]
MLVPEDFARLMLLLLVANGAPVLLHRWLGARGAWPLDGGRTSPVDGRRWLGPSKTWRGVAAALVATMLMAWLVSLPVMLGFWIGLAAMAGDLLSSLLKRRLGLASGAMALGLDQIPESLLPLLLARDSLGLGVAAIAAGVLLFLVLELALSRLLFRLRLRERPY